MTESLVAHTLAIAHGAGAALLSLATFYLLGLLLLPRRMQHYVRWSDCLALGLALFIVLCWVAITARRIPLIYVALLFGAVVWLLLALRLRWAQNTLTARVVSPATRRWVTDFSLLYLLACVLMAPSPRGGLLPLAPEGNLELVTYARYGRQVLERGTATLELAPFEHLRSPAGIFLLAWQSLPFRRDPLEAAMPTMCMLAALCGMLAAEGVRAAFSASRRTAFVIAAVGMCAPVFRWAVSTFALAELMTAAAMLAAAGALARAAARRAPAGLVPAMTACATVLWFAAPTSAWRPANIVSGFGELSSIFSPAALVGLPQIAPIGSTTSPVSAVATAMVLAGVPVLWAAAVHLFHRSGAVEWMTSSDTDRQLARSLAAYAVAALLIGNVAVHAVHGPDPIRRSGAWRQLGDASRSPLHGVTLKVADAPGGLSTALALYYLGDRKADVFGGDVPPERLSFETVARQQPMFIENLGCDGVGHRDTMSIRGVGCLLLAPPSLTLGETYQFNRTYLFLSYDYMSGRDPGGRWNTRPVLHLELTADPQRAGLDHDRFINVLVHPFLPEGVKPHRLLLRWGTARHGETLVADRQWLSIPVRSGDWFGNRLWKLPIAIDLPEGRRILFQEIALTESPRGDVISSAAQPATAQRPGVAGG